MDKQEKINELFRVAREQEPKTSFDQTKDQFLNSLKNKTVKTKDGQVFTLKKWIIMLSSIIVITGLSIGFLNQNVESVQAKTNTSQQAEKKSTYKKNNQHNQKTLNNIQLQIKDKINPKEVSGINPSFLKENTLFDLNLVDLTSLLNKYQGIPFDDTLKTKPFSFPKLTTRDIKGIAKQKSAILKSYSKLDLKKYTYLPSGNLNYNGLNVSIQAFYIQKTEVTNLEYRTFLYDLLIQNRKEEYLKAMPDEAMWFKLFGEGMKSVGDLYFTHPAYDNYPVCNITQQGVEMYCSWIMDELKRAYPKKNFDNFLPRIPTRVEWVYAASSRGKNMVYPWGSDSTISGNGCYMCNYKPLIDNFHIDGGFHSVAVNSYNPTQYDLFNMSGNVAELVYNVKYSEEKGWKYGKSDIGTAGGGWMNNAEEIKILAKDNHPGIVDPHPNVGFRIVFTHLGR